MQWHAWIWLLHLEVKNQVGEEERRLVAVFGWQEAEDEVMAMTSTAVLCCNLE